MDKMIKNIFSDMPGDLSEEFMETLVEGRGVVIERIVSRGQSSPPGFWYDQDKNEFVFLVCGEAHIKFEEGRAIVSMKSGDYLIIPAHKRHRIEWTSAEEDTIWLTVYY